MVSNMIKQLSRMERECSEYSKAHNDASKKFSRKNTILNIINIATTSGTATLAAATMNDLDTRNTVWFSVINITSTVLLYLSACINYIQQTLNFEKRSEQNKTLAIRFLSLSNNIKKFTVVQEINNEDAVEYYKWAVNEYEQIIMKTTMVIGGGNQGSLTNDTDAISDDINITVSDVSYSSNIQKDPKLKYEIDRFVVNSFNES